MKRSLVSATCILVLAAAVTFACQGFLDTPAHDVLDDDAMANRVGVEGALVAAYHHALGEHGVESYELERCWDDYRYGLFQGPLITVLGAMFAVRTDRGDEMFRAMTQRGCAAIRETGAFELL